MKKPLATIGALALLAWTGLGAVAWWRAGREVTITFQEGERQDDGLALLVDRLATLEADMDALVGSLGENFGLLADALGAQPTGDVESAREIARLEQRLRALEAAVPAALEARETAGALREVLARLERVAARGDALALSAPVEVAATAPLAEPVPSEPAAEEPAAPSEPVVEAPPAAPARKSFLAFSLPTRDFSFAGEQAFEILPDLSRVGFDGKSTLHDFTGVSDAVRGGFQLDLARPQDGITGKVTVATRSLVTGLEGRDEAMLEHLDAETHGELSFEPTALAVRESDPAGMRLAGTLRGRMTIHGTTRDVELAVRAHVDDARRLVVEGETPLLLGDYGVEAPSKLGMISMEDEVRVWIHLRARARAVEGRQ